MAGRVVSPVASRAYAVARERGRLLVGCAFSALTLVGCLLVSRHLTRTSWPLQRAHVGRHARLHRAAGRLERRSASTARSALAAGCFLLGCWTARALGSAVLLAALGVAFSPTLALVVLCLGAAASLLPITSGGGIVNVGMTASILLALGIGKDQAINFGLASGLLLCGTALLAALVGVTLSLTNSLRARTPAPANA